MKIKYIESNDPVNLYTTMVNFRRFFYNRNLLKDDISDLVLSLYNKNIFDYIEFSHELIVNEKTIRINSLSLKQTYLINFYKNFDKNILLDNEIYLNAFIDKIFELFELYFNKKKTNDFSPNYLYKYIIHMVDILRTIYFKLNKEDS